MLAMLLHARANTVLGPYMPLFKGIDHAVGTNTSGGTGMPDLQVAYIVRVDLTDPDIKLLTTSPAANFRPEYSETLAMTVGTFLKTNKLQLAVNANDFKQSFSDASPPYDIPQGTPLDVRGVLISEGQVVSSQQANEYNSAMLFTSNNQASVVFTNWPAVSTDGIYNAVCGTYPILINGTNIGRTYLPPYPDPKSLHQVQPRTAFGLSADRHYFYMLIIDGRQGGYSDGALDWETAQWLQLAGAADGINMDGGGSSTLAMADSTGQPIDLNHSSCYASYGWDRPIGAHLGIYAKPAPGFINDVAANADNTAATITWTTLLPATTQVAYDLTTNYTKSSPRYTATVTNHAVLFTNLQPNTGYYFKVFSSVGSSNYISDDFYFVTSNYVTTASILDLTNTWSYCTDNLDGQPWTATSYNDSQWSSGPATLWVDVRGPNMGIPSMDTQLPYDPNNYRYPFVSYYFRTHFNFTNLASNLSFVFTAYVDDGAIFYLNGSEIYRLRMADYPTPISNSTMATGYPGTGDATVADIISVTGLTNLVNGDNVIAVEVHNYGASSPDITFGTSLDATFGYDISPELSVTQSNNRTVVSWTRGGFTLWQSSSITGPWTPVVGPVVSSPYTATNNASATFYRLQR